MMERPLRLILSCLFAICLPLHAFGQSNERFERFYQAARIKDTLALMHEEHLSYSSELEREVFPGRGGVRWAEQVARIFALERLDKMMHAHLESVLAERDLAPFLQFYESDLGKRIVRLELEARRAFMDTAVKEASMERVAMMQDEGHPRLQQVERMINAWNLQEMNVAAALNSNLALYRGMAIGGGMGVPLDDEEIKRQIWSDEEALRLDVGQWLRAYMVLSYNTLSDDEMEIYLTYVGSEPAVALNLATFRAFDDIYALTSYELGLAVARMMQGDDI